MMTTRSHKKKKESAEAYTQRKRGGGGGGIPDSKLISAIEESLGSMGKPMMIGCTKSFSLSLDSDFITFTVAK